MYGKVFACICWTVKTWRIIYQDVNKAAMNVRGFERRRFAAHHLCWIFALCPLWVFESNALRFNRNQLLSKLGLHRCADLSKLCVIHQRASCYSRLLPWCNRERATREMPQVPEESSDLQRAMLALTLFITSSKNSQTGQHCSFRQLVLGCI